MMVFFDWITGSDKKKEEEKKQEQIAEAKRFFAEVNQNKKIPIITTSILLKKMETAHLEADVVLSELRAVRRSSGGAVRIMKGVYIGGGSSRSHDELRKIDNGKLTLTNKRLVFDGVCNTRSVNIERILSVQAYSDGIEVAIEGKGKSQIYTGMSNSILWKALISILNQLPEGELPTININFE